MRKILTVLILFFTVTSNAQFFQKDTTLSSFIDSSKITIPITLKADHHFLIIDCLEGLQKSEWIAYASQIANAMDTVYRPEKSITVSLPSGLIVDMFFQMSAQQERFSVAVNNDLRSVLLPQLISYPWLYRELQNINTQNASLLLQRKLRAFSFLKQMKAK